MKGGETYIMSNYDRTVLYVGVTNDLERRVLEHKLGNGSTFTSKYGCKFLLFYENFPQITQAIEREKQLKNWTRTWKLELIAKENPKFDDLAADWYHPDDLVFRADPGSSPG